MNNFLFLFVCFLIHSSLLLTPSAQQQAKFSKAISFLPKPSNSSLPWYPTPQPTTLEEAKLKGWTIKDPTCIPGLGIVSYPPPNGTYAWIFNVDGTVVGFFLAGFTTGAAILLPPFQSASPGDFLAVPGINSTHYRLLMFWDNPDTFCTAGSSDPDSVGNRVVARTVVDKSTNQTADEILWSNNWSLKQFSEVQPRFSVGSSCSSNKGVVTTKFAAFAVSLLMDEYLNVIGFGTSVGLPQKDPTFWAVIDPSFPLVYGTTWNGFVVFRNVSFITGTLCKSPALQVDVTQWRTYDGTYNNLGNTTGSGVTPGDDRYLWGSGGYYFNQDRGVVYINTTANEFGPYTKDPNPGCKENCTRPNARLISNLLGSPDANGGTVYSDRSLNDLHTYWGHLVTSDISNTGRSPFSMDLVAPTCDLIFDATCAGNKPITGISVAAYARRKGTQFHYNLASSFLDAGFLYGGIVMARTRVTRNGVPSCKLIEDIIIPSGNLATDGGPWRWAGDIRRNKTPLLNSFATIFLREHNYQCDQLESNLKNFNGSTTGGGTGGGDWDDERWFQEARKRVIAIYQKITTREYLAGLLGTPLPPYDQKNGYNQSLDPTLMKEFSAAAYRMGHSKVNTRVARVDSTFTTIKQGDVLIRDVIYRPKPYMAEGFEPILLGGLVQKQQEADTIFVDDVRNYMLGTNDLFAINIMRGRDFGLKSYNDVRADFGLPRVTTWSQITSNQRIQSLLQSLYGSIANLDLYVGGLAEDVGVGVDTSGSTGATGNSTVSYGYGSGSSTVGTGSSVGPTFTAIIKEQFKRLRAGDRFWYEREGYFTPQELTSIYGTTLEMLVTRHTNIKPETIGQGIFYSKSRQLSTLSVSSGAFFLPTSGYPNTVDLGSSYRLAWSVEGPNIHFFLQTLANGWLGIGFEPLNNTMKGADIYLCYISQQGMPVVRDSYAQDVGVPTLDTDLGGTDDSFNISGSFTNGVTAVKFSRKLVTNDDLLDRQIWNKPGGMKIIFAFNPDTTELVYHGPTRNSSYYLNFFPPGKEVVSLPKWVQGVVGAGAGLGILVALVIFGLTIPFPTHFRAKSVFFCRAISLATVFGFIGAIFTIPDPPTTALCTLYPWFLGISFMILFASLFAKTFRVYRVFTTSADKLNAATLTNARLVHFIMLPVALEIVFLIVWTVVDRPTATTEITNYDSNKIHTYCKTNMTFWIVGVAFKGGFCLLGVVLAVMTRGVPKPFNDAQPIALTIYNIFLTGVVALAIGFGLRDWYIANILAAAFGIIASYSFTLFVLFGGIILRIFTGAPAQTFTPGGATATASPHFSTTVTPRATTMATTANGE